MSVIIFGIGVYYKKYKSSIFAKDKVIALCDNNEDLQGTLVDGIPVIAPSELFTIQYDCIVLLLNRFSASNVRNQLISLGIDNNSILFYDEYISIRYSGECTLYASYASSVQIVLISSALVYDGGSMSIISAARSLLSYGYSITLVAPSADIQLINELNGFGISVVVYPAFENMGEKELEWIKKFDFAVVNAFVMIDCAVKICNVLPVFLWLHDPSTSYPYIFSRWSKYLKDERIYQIPVFAVSSVARREFKKYYPKASIRILPYCVKDEYGVHEKKIDFSYKNKITFALIAGFFELKQQRLFLEVAQKLNESHFDYVRFLLVGKAGNGAYSREVTDFARKIPNVDMTGVLTRTQIADLYKNEIDVVVCPSLEETMSLTITEGMMWSKLCICSDNTGMAEYITDGENGFICKTGNLESLYGKMRYCVEHYDELDSVRKNARRTYEENFTMDVFAKRMEEIIKNIRGLTV